MQRRKFNREFKIGAVRLVRERGVSKAQAPGCAAASKLLLVAENRADRPQGLPDARRRQSGRVRLQREICEGTRPSATSARLSSKGAD
jgi:transposase-like protein